MCAKYEFVYLNNIIQKLSNERSWIGNNLISVLQITRRARSVEKKVELILQSVYQKLFKISDKKDKELCSIMIEYLFFICDNNQ